MSASMPREAASELALQETLRFLTRFPVGDRPRVLEVGCGEGALAVRLGEIGWDVLGIDVDDARVATAVARGVRAQRADLLTFEHEPFDVVLVTHSLHHISPAEAAVERIAKLLRPGGWLLVEEYDHSAVDDVTERWLSERRALLREAGVAAHDGPRLHFHKGHSAHGHSGDQRGHASHACHKRGQHAGHEHGEHAGHAHGEHAGLKHREHGGQKHGEHAGRAHGDHAAHRHGNHAEHRAVRHDRETGHKEHLHTGSQMQRALEARFKPVVVERGAYLYRYLCAELEATPRGLNLARLVLEQEQHALASGEIRPVGFRFVAQASVAPER